MTKSALNSDLAVSARAAGAAAPAAEQLDFLAPVARSVNKHDAAGMADLVAESQARRKRGRPKGAENLSSRQLREMITRAADGVPILQSASYLALEPEEMALRLGISTVEAFDRQEAIRARFDRLFVAPLAPTDEKGNAVPGLVISIGDQAINAGIGVSAGGSPPWLAAYRDAEGRVIEGVEIQGVSGSRAEITDQEEAS